MYHEQIRKLTYEESGGPEDSPGKLPLQGCGPVHWHPEIIRVASQCRFKTTTCESAHNWPYHCAIWQWIHLRFTDHLPNFPGPFADNFLLPDDPDGIATAWLMRNGSNLQRTSGSQGWASDLRCDFWP